jgi:hypothetical protein
MPYSNLKRRRSLCALNHTERQAYRDFRTQIFKYNKSQVGGFRSIKGRHTTVHAASSFTSLRVLYMKSVTGFVERHLSIRIFASETAKHTSTKCDIGLSSTPQAVKLI